MNLKALVCVALGFFLGAALFRTSSLPRKELVLRPSDSSPSLRPQPADEPLPVPTADSFAAWRRYSPDAPPARTTTSESRTGGWREELRAWIDSGEILEELAREPTTMGCVLLEISLARGDVERAASLLEELPVADTESRLRVADRLLAAGETHRATELYLRAFEEDPWDAELTSRLVDLAPAQALARMEEEWYEDPADVDHDIGDWQNRALLLHRVGRREEAGEILLRVAAENILQPESLEILVALAPEEAEAILRAKTMRGGCVPATEEAAQLVRFLEETGRTGDAVRFLLDEHGGYWAESAHEELLRLAPARWERRLLEELRDHPDDELRWGRVGDCREARGDVDGAVEAWLSSLEIEPDGQIAAKVVEYAPERVFPLIERALDDEEDYTWGLYGDLCWQRGRRADAHLAWERAREIYPESSSWFDRLERLELGLDPLPSPSRRESLPEILEYLID